jgi:nitrite reductase/ring-hydroxylating ferredoxin subunit
MNRADDRGACPCSAHGRRDFLHDGAALVAGLFAAIGISGTAADAWSMTFGEAIGAAGDECTYRIPAGDGATIDRENQVILVRFQNKGYAFLLACPHQNTALRWLGAEGRFQCPRHESKYRPDGAFIEGRATRNMDRFAVRRSGDALVVDLARWFQSDTQKSEWAAAFVQL